MPRKKTPAKVADPNDIFAQRDQFALTLNGDESEKKDEKPDALQAALSQIAELNKRLDQRDREQLALMTVPPSMPKTPVAPKAMDFSGLPDPLGEPEKYAVELSARVRADYEARANYEREQLNASKTTDDRVNGLWTEFAEKYEDKADNQKRVEFAATEVAKRAREKGIDVEKYMFQHRDRFLEDVAKEYDEIFAAPEKEEDADDGRSAGVFGGAESQYRPAPSAKKADGDMVKELQDMQVKSGFF